MWMAGSALEPGAFPTPRLSLSILARYQAHTSRRATLVTASAQGPGLTMPAAIRRGVKARRVLSLMGSLLEWVGLAEGSLLGDGLVRGSLNY